MHVVMIIPTGIRCEIGGHAGDATPAARLLGSVCDKLILHPNVVNASAINEMPENALYVEGSILDRFLEGKIELREVRQNKILMVVNKPVYTGTVNTATAARAVLGIDVQILELDTPLIMKAEVKNGIASGTYSGVEQLIKQVSNYEFDALAVETAIEFDEKLALEYFKVGGTNPWGGIEAKTSRAIADKLNKPVAHAPFEEYKKGTITCYSEIVDPRMAAEVSSGEFSYCVLKGLHKAPRISQHHSGMGMGLSVNDIDVMVSPFGCWGRPHIACEKAGIPIIVVKENKTVCEHPYGHCNPIWVKNYLEAAGYISCMRAGISPESVRRPLADTIVLSDEC